MKHINAIIAGLALSLAALGCAQKKDIKPEIKPQAVATPAPSPEAQAPVETVPLERYTVRKGDSLWSISAGDSVMGDSMRWPLLYRQNRDAITDPDMIEISQELSYRKEMTLAEINDAVQKAQDTPDYVPQSRRAKALPLQY
jgi:hypothetical protein